jgi:hypothetical protein
VQTDVSTHRKDPSILDHDALPEDHEVGRLRRDGGVWDWDEHRATYDLAASRAMALFDDLRSLAGLQGAIARGLFSVATSSDEDHFAIRVQCGQSYAYKWPTVPPAEESTDVVLVGAFLGARQQDEVLLEPRDIPLAVERAFVIQRNVPVLICIVSEEGLLGKRFQLTPAFFDRLMADRAPLNASEADVQLSRWVRLLKLDELAARFKDLATQCNGPSRRGPWRAVVSRLTRPAS